ncbi:hypothetical protein LCI18_000363 [Fusarium solani-melongenae]|uniref:Uncharacterized protein n=1 Tax=Fusarium solani subsp. cucurbitae TaxID=2747967 RepID=A0ACD3YKQ7_FUSSC|nr:hypothetical protein LCI18_000363 [Fusarium solani-melongenae]
MSFIIYKYYDCLQQEVMNEDLEAKKARGKPKADAQQVTLISKDMVAEKQPMGPPYTWWYHRRKSHEIQNLPKDQARLVMALVDWIEDSYGSLFDSIDDQLCRGRVSNFSIPFLLRPGDVLVSNENGFPEGHLVLAPPRVERDTGRDKQGDQQSEAKRTVPWWVHCRSLLYSGVFYWAEEDIELVLSTEIPNEGVDIATLDVVPLKYATHDAQETLVQRAKMWWKLRHKQLVSYEGTPSTGAQARHPYNSPKVETYSPKDDKGPQTPEIYLFPTMAPGFDLRRKKWVDLEVDQIREVIWNDKAFGSLVADEDMKEFILALVTNLLETEKGTDLIDNKGNGLIMLLHGSPGTGKTFTAESVAEIAKKPLYPVTCGDIGTEPEQVEKYLQSVFHLGKIWDCVVLLDEAEVFLEQRTLQDLKRNALVSVFLRALEYYEGILILTTNRVGTFDEAFKSRIQLALRYEKLQGYQRRQIWRNFFGRLKEIGEEDKIDFDIQLNLDELSQYEMNGRQIRNSITTARQLAKYQKRKMTFSHLKRAITVADKFDRYLADVQEGIDEEVGGRGEDGRYSDESIARQDGVR